MILEISKPPDTYKKLTRHILPLLELYNFCVKQFFHGTHNLGVISSVQVK